MLHAWTSLPNNLTFLQVAETVYGCWLPTTLCETFNKARSMHWSSICVTPGRYMGIKCLTQPVVSHLRKHDTSCLSQQWDRQTCRGRDGRGRLLLLGMAPLKSRAQHENKSWPGFAIWDKIGCCLWGCLFYIGWLTPQDLCIWNKELHMFL